MNVAEVKEKYPLLKRDNSPRKIGYEIEYAGLSLESSAQYVASCFGGNAEKQHDNKYFIETADGTFIVLVDFELLQEISELQAHSSKSQVEELLSDTAKTILESVSENMAPLEIVTPPLELSRIPEMDRFCNLLVEKGAQGTQKSPLYGFGLHLNIDIPEMDEETIKNYLQAYCLLEVWLERQINRDITRMMTMYTSPYPTAYKRQVCRMGYCPSMDVLINDYLRCNSTRNHALDMLPLFAVIDEDKVRLATDNNALVKKRPAFHYRFPDCRLGDSSWSPSKEWNRWEVVEAVANDDKLRSELLSLWENSYIFGFFSERKYIQELQKIL